MELTFGNDTIQALPVSKSTSTSKDMRQLGDVKRADGSSVFAEVTTTHAVVHGKDAVSTSFVIREPVVLPNGRFIEATVNLRVEKPGIVWVTLHENGSLQLSAHAASKGAVFYYDMCKGRVDGVKPSKKCWDTWEAVRQLRFKGQRADDGALPLEDWAHPEILRRRKKVRNGVEFLDAKAMKAAIKAAQSDVDSLPVDARKKLSERAEDLAANG